MAEQKPLTWGKTYPELSSKHAQTVCTGAVDAEGRSIRLCPVPFFGISKVSNATASKTSWRCVRTTLCATRDTVVQERAAAAERIAEDVATARAVGYRKVV